jgi:hypothetical protein
MGASDHTFQVETREGLVVREQSLDQTEQIAWTERLGQVLGEPGAQGALAIFGCGVRRHSDHR